MLKAYWEIEVRDKDGKVIKRRRFRSHSYLRQFIAMIRGIQFHTHGTSNVGNTTVKDITGTDRGYPANAYIYAAGMPVNCVAASSEYGLVVGTGTGANSTATYALQSQITHGTGTGQLSYGSHTFEALTVSGSDVYFRIIRTYTNYSGAGITVNEVGIYTKALDSGGTARVFCIARDLVSGGILVPNGATLTLRYLQKITVG